MPSFLLKERWIAGPLASIRHLGKRSFQWLAHLYGTVMLRSRGADPKRHSLIIAEGTYSPWLFDADFRAAYRNVRGSTLVGEQRCYELWHLVAQVAELEGDILEVGVWRGGTGAVLAKRAQLEGLDAKVYLCDTFQGVVKAGPKDSVYVGGEHSDVTSGSVERLLRAMGLDNVELLVGVFPDETGPLMPADRGIRLCHIDVDVYRSAKDVLAWVWDRLSPGGVVVFDDFGFPECEGVTKLVNEEASKPDRLVVQNLNGHGIMVKLPPRIET
jgi:O-methyltransferase